MFIFGMVIGFILGVLALFLFGAWAALSESKNEAKAGTSTKTKTLSLNESQTKKLLKTLQNSAYWSKGELEWTDFDKTGYPVGERTVFRRNYDDYYYDDYCDEEDAVIKISSHNNEIVLSDKLAREYAQLPENLFHVSQLEYAVFIRWCARAPKLRSADQSVLLNLDRLSSKGMFESKYDALRRWRIKQGEVEQCHPSNILEDRVLGILAERMPVDKNSLLAIPGVETAKWDKYAEQVVEILNQYRKSPL